jgi:hypothetical protein
VPASLRRVSPEGLLDDQEVRAERQRQKDRSQQLEDDVRQVMATANGRRFVWELVDTLCGTFAGSFAGEPHATSFNEGRRSVGLAVMQQVQRLSPREWVQALAEALASREARTPSPAPGTLEE